MLNPNRPMFDSTQRIQVLIQCNGKFLGCRRKALLIITNHKLHRAGDICFCISLYFHQLHKIHFPVKIFHIHTKNIFMFLKQFAIFLYIPVKCK